MCCTTMSETEYNRSGELQLLDLDEITCLPVAGHFVHGENGAIKRETVTDFVFTRNEEHFFTSGYDSNIKLWRSKDGALMKTMRGHRHIVNALDHHKNRFLVASASNDGYVCASIFCLHTCLYAQFTVLSTCGSTTKRQIMYRQRPNLRRSVPTTIAQT